MINNYEQILQILPDEPEEDLVYYCQIIKRKKDHPGLEGKNNSAMLIKFYYFACKTDMEKRWEEMVAISEAVGARIMIDAFPKHSSKVKYAMIKRLAEILEDKQEAKLHRLYNTCYGQMKPAKGRALWLIDWDEGNSDKLVYMINETTKNLDKRFHVEVIHKIPTRQGWHFLIKPCDLSYFDRILDINGITDLNVHKTSPTLIYIPKSLNKYNNESSSI